MDPLSALSDSLAALAAKASSRLFHVPSPLGGRTALGFDGRRLLVPAFRAEEGEELEILAPGGKPVKAKVAGFDPRRGLAVLALETPIPGSAWAPMKGLPALGSLVLAAAYPSPEGPETRLDAIRCASAKEGDAAYLQTDGTPYPGFSGAALVAPAGELAGFVVSDMPGNDGLAIPAANAAALVEAIIARGFPGRAWLGVSTIPVEAPANWKKVSGDDRDVALLVVGMEAGSPADEAGLMVGDILLSIGGAPLSRPEDLRAALDAALPGTALAVAAFRGGNKIELSVIPSRAPADGMDSGGRHRRHGGYSGQHGWGGDPGKWARGSWRRGGGGAWGCCGDR
jgi:S1-C subfamily serine protease